MSTVKEFISSLVSNGVDLPDSVDPNALFVDAMKQGYTDLGFAIAKEHDINLTSLMAVRGDLKGKNFARWMSLFFSYLSRQFEELSESNVGETVGELSKSFVNGMTEKVYEEQKRLESQTLSGLLSGLSPSDLRDILRSASN